MKTSSRTKGARAEKAAESFLKRQGYMFLERNFRTSYGEIDLVMKHDDTIVFIEVKSGTSDPDFSPGLHFNADKSKRLQRLAFGYLTGLGNPEVAARIDVMLVRDCNGRFEFEHFVDVTSVS